MIPAAYDGTPIGTVNADIANLAKALEMTPVNLGALTRELTGKYVNHTYEDLDAVREALRKMLRENTRMLDEIKTTEQTYITTDYGLRIDPETGEVLGLEPWHDVDVEDKAGLARWLGEKIASHRSKLAAIEAEKAEWIKTISVRYDPLINQHKNSINWLSMQWADDLRDWAKSKLDGKRKSITEGLLKLSFRASPASVEVVDNEAALAWLKKNCPEAVKVTEAVAKSAIPDSVKVSLVSEAAPQTGIIFHPAGERETFTVE